MKMPKIRIPTLILFALFLNPIIIGGIEIGCYLLLYGSALLYIGFHAKYIFDNYFKKINIKIAVPLIWIVIALVFSVIIPFIHETNDFSYVNVILGIFRKAIIYVFLILVLTKRCRREMVIENFMLYYSLASVLYVISTFVFTLLPSLRSIWQSLLHLDDSTLHLFSSYGYANRFGWAGFAGFRNTIECTVSLIFLVYLYASKDRKFDVKTGHFVFLTLVCFLGNMFYGRSGVIASFICLTIGLLLYKRMNLKALLFIVGGVIIGAFLISVLRNRIHVVDEWYNWASIPFYNLIKTGSFNNYSANRLLNEMIFLPDVNTMIWGDGRYINASTGLYYMRTDSGFMRQILFWGVGLTGFMYACWLHSLFIIKRDWIFKLMLFIMCVLFEIKGEVYYELLPLFLIIAMIDYKTLISPQKAGRSNNNVSWQSDILNNSFQKGKKIL